MRIRWWSVGGTELSKYLALINQESHDSRNYMFLDLVSADAQSLTRITDVDSGAGTGSEFSSAT